MMYIIIPSFFGILYLGGWIYFSLYTSKLGRKEKEIAHIFISRTDSVTGLYEVSKFFIERQQEVFAEILSLRKKEFALIELSSNIEAVYELESRIHHELNFIFQVCNTHPQLLKNKKFLYIRDVIVEKSSELGRNISQYNTYVNIYNQAIKHKKYTIIGIFLPFHKKELLE